MVGSKGVDWKEVVGAMSCGDEADDEELEEAAEDVEEAFLPVRVPHRDMLDWE